MGRRKKGAIVLPTTSVGGTDISLENTSVATTAGTKHIKTPSQIIVKPIDTRQLPNKPLDLRKDAGAFDNEYIELAKKYLGIPVERTPTLVEFAKYIIDVIDAKNKTIERLSLPRNDFANRIYTSSEINGSWN